MFVLAFALALFFDVQSSLRYEIHPFRHECCCIDLGSDAVRLFSTPIGRRESNDSVPIFHVLAVGYPSHGRKGREWHRSNRMLSD